MDFVGLRLGDRFLELADHRSEHGAEIRVCATATALGPQSIFQRILLPHGRVALRTLGGLYLSCQPDRGSNFALMTAEHLGPREVFEEIRYPDEAVALRSCDLTYVSGHRAGGGRVVVNRTEADAAARFHYEPVPQAQIPAQSAREEPVTYARRS